MNDTQELLNKDELAEILGLTRRGVECLVAKRKIPVLRISNRIVRFNLHKVMKALDQFEQREVILRK